MTTDIQLSGFDYAALDAETRIVVQQRTTEIRDLTRRTAQDIIDIGHKLIEVKQRLEHGQFGAWLEAEFAWTDRMARRAMAVARMARAGTVFATGDELNNIGKSALYILCARSAPRSALVAAIRLATQGVRVNKTMAQALIAGQTITAVQAITEYALEEMISQKLTSSGITHERQVPCSVGRADIVTPDAIYEIKHPIDAEGMFKAVGQALLYRACINPQARAVVVFVKPATSDFDPFIEAACASGVEVMLWSP